MSGNVYEVIVHPIIEAIVGTREFMDTNFTTSVLYSVRKASISPVAKQSYAFWTTSLKSCQLHIWGVKVFLT